MSCRYSEAERSGQISALTPSTLAVVEMALQPSVVGLGTAHRLARLGSPFQTVAVKRTCRCRLIC